MAERNTQVIAIATTTAIAFISGFMLGVYSIRGYLISPALAEERRRNIQDPEESEESDIDEADTILDHAPNWANGAEADRRQGLKVQDGANTTNAQRQQKPSPPAADIVDKNEECKLVLVVRTDLGMTKGTSILHMHLPMITSQLGLLTSCRHKRQDRGTVRPRHAGVLQEPDQGRAEEGRLVARGPPVGALGAARAGQDRSAD